MPISERGESVVNLDTLQSLRYFEAHDGGGTPGGWLVEVLRGNTDGDRRIPPGAGA